MENGPITQAITLDQVIQAAKAAEATLQYINISKALEAATNSPKKVYTVNQDSQIDSLRKEIAELKTALTISKKEEDKSRWNNKYTCFNCGSSQHFAKDCP